MIKLEIETNQINIKILEFGTWLLFSDRLKLEY